MGILIVYVCVFVTGLSELKPGKWFATDCCMSFVEWHVIGTEIA